MKRRNKAISKIILILFVFLLAVTDSLHIVSAEQLTDKNESSINSLQETQFHGKTEDSMIPEFALQPLDISPISVNNSVYNADWNGKLNELIKQANIERENRLFPEDQFNYTKQEIEELIMQGATVEDIYMSDYIGNVLLENPKDLILLKKERDINWEQIDNEIKNEKQIKIETLLKKFSSKENNILNIKMSLAEKLILLEAIEYEGLNNADELVESYQNLGFNGLNRDISFEGKIKIEESSVTNSVYDNTRLVNGKSVTESVYATSHTVNNKYSNMRLNINSVLDGLITQQLINQTNKQQFASNEGTETIDPVTGKLSWKRTDIHLPGRDGLDLNLGVMYNSNYSFDYMRNTPGSDQLWRYNYLVSRYDLGVGWSFQFPSVQNADGYLYYHRGDGPIYQVDFNATDTLGSYTHLIGYEGKDVKFIQDNQGSYSNGQSSSAYFLEYADKKREYFASDGRLLGIVDRFGNEIKFQHIDRQLYDGQTYKVISTITDSIGRKISFEYQSTLQTTGTFSGENIKVTVLDLNGIVKQTVTYQKWRLAYSDVSGYSPYLWLIQDQNSEFTTFDITKLVGYHDYWAKNYSSNHGNIYYYGLANINYPRSSVKFQYDKITRNWGPYGYAEEFRVKNKFNQIKKDSNLQGDINHINYLYEGDYTGYPNYFNPNSIPVSHSYSSSSVIQSTSLTNGLISKSNFNGVGQVTSTESIAANGEKKIITNLAFHPTQIYKPTLIQSEDYGVGDTTATTNKLIWDMQYNDWGGVQSSSLPLTQTEFNDSSIKRKHTITYTYDPNYYFLKTKSWYQNINNTTLLSETTDYYSNGRLKSYTNAKNEITTYCYEAVDVNGIVTSNCTNASNVLVGKVRLIRESTNLGNGQTTLNEVLYDNSTVYAYPSETRSTFSTKSNRGLDITQTVKKTMLYDLGMGLIKEEKDSNNGKTSYTYDNLGRVKTITYPSFTNLSNVKYNTIDEYNYINTTIPLSAIPNNTGVNSVMIEYGRKYIQQSNGATTILSKQKSYYDGIGNLLYDLVSNNGTEQINQYQYDDLSRPIVALDPMNNSTNVTYDAWGIQKEASDAYGNLYISERNLKLRRNINYFIAAADIALYRANPLQDNIKESYIEQDYDHHGQHITTRAYKDWPMKNQELTERFSYDIAGNLIGYIDPKNNLNGDGVTTRYGYDTLNRLISVKDAIGQITKYQYNVSGQITNTTMQLSDTDTPKVLNEKTFTETGLISAKTDPSLKSDSYTYDKLGLLNQRTDRNDTVVYSDYDEQFRNTVKTAWSGVEYLTQQSKVNFGSLGIQKDTYELYESGILKSSLVTTIDNLKRTTSINIQSQSYTSNLELSYDKNNRITSVNSIGNANNAITNLKYDKLRLSKVQTNGQTVINDADSANVKYLYYPNGLLKSITYPPIADGSILKSEYEYTKLKQVSTLINKRGSTVLSSTSYSYDKNGNIETSVQVMKDKPTISNVFTYDKLNRIIGVTRSNGHSISYTYDLKGNRLTSTDIALFPITININSYSYDLFNNLKSTTKGSLTTTFEYDPNGMRFKKSSNGNIKQYRYNHNKEVVAEMSGNNQTYATYIRGDRLLLKKDVITAKDYYYLYNGHGDVIQIVDTDGNIVNNYTYDEWGNITQQVEGIPNSFKYAGEEFDNETGLYYLRARYYDPTMGRFLNEDTYEGDITNPLTLNLYTYVVNNPLIYSDPSGHDHVFNQNQYDYLMNLYENGSIGQSKWAYSQLDDGRYYIDKAKPKEVLTLDEAIYADANVREDHVSEFIMDTFITGGSGLVIKAGKAAGKTVFSKIAGLFSKPAAQEIGFHGGRAGELYLAKSLGADATQVFFKTTQGRRFIDVLHDGIAHESKVGYVSLTSFTEKQILKDAELIKNGTVDGAIWHFYKSGVTGRGGASQPLLDMLTANGIKYVIEIVYK
ncbi:RHS repeat domain-containing protein [Paenibacillus sp. NRS-1760]|uniref:RHS repeat domain-containing protein n=1 Tax=Paenibacillus sp. NRS-1760 TaxID=3233902 RepID=UPI003D2D8542